MPNRVGSCTRGHKRPGRNVAVRMRCARSFSGASSLPHRDHHVDPVPAPGARLSETNLMAAGSGAAYGIPPGAQHPELELPLGLWGG